MKRRGNCYVTCEALYHLLGGKKAGWTPASMPWQNDTHWVLRHQSGLVLDPTADQFQAPPDYSGLRNRGFLTAQPSKRAQILMDMMVWQDKGVTK